MALDQLAISTEGDGVDPSGWIEHVYCLVALCVCSVKISANFLHLDKPLCDIYKTRFFSPPLYHRSFQAVAYPIQPLEGSTFPGTELDPLACMLCYTNQCNIVRIFK